MLADDPDSPGSLGIAISEAVRPRRVRRDALRARIGAQPRADAPDGDRAGGRGQFEMAGEAGPDLIVGCTGGGSNFDGLVFPFLREKLAGG